MIALRQQLELLPRVGQAVRVVGSVDELRGHLTERFTYYDGSAGGFVELDDTDGVVIAVPLRELQAVA